jgi:DNA-binding MarR family transcriptional regulator
MSTERLHWRFIAMWLRSLKRCRPVSDFKVAFAIACATDKATGEAFPSVAALSKAACVSERSVRAALRRLEAAGHLAVERVPNRSDRFTMIVRRRQQKEAGT